MTSILFMKTRSNLKQLLKEIEQICDELGLFINAKKTQIIKLSKGFTFLKIKYSLTDTGKVVQRVSRDSVTRMRRKLKKASYQTGSGRDRDSRMSDVHIIHGVEV